MRLAVAVAYQKTEEERHDHLKGALETIVQIKKERIQHEQDALQRLEHAIQQMNRENDIQAFAAVSSKEWEMVWFELYVLMVSHPFESFSLGRFSFVLFFRCLFVFVYAHVCVCECMCLCLYVCK